MGNTEFEWESVVFPKLIFRMFSQTNTAFPDIFALIIDNLLINLCKIEDVDTECKLDEEECTDFKIGVTLLE